MMTDIAGNQLGVNDEVVLHALPENAISGLPEEEAAFLQNAAGRIVKVSEIDEHGVEITITDDASGIIHFLRVVGSDLLKV